MSTKKTPFIAGGGQIFLVHLFNIINSTVLEEIKTNYSQMKKHLFALLWLTLVCAYPLRAQQVFSNGGGSFQNAEASITFTVGETVISTFTNPNATLTQGFNQALDSEIQLEDASGNLGCGGDLLFATVEPGDNSTVLLTIRNESSTGPLSIRALDFSGDPVFSIASPPSLPLSIPANQQTELTLQFAPDQANDFTGALSIENNDADEGICIINLSASAQVFDLPALPLPALLLLGMSVLLLGVRSVRRLGYTH